MQDSADDLREYVKKKLRRRLFPQAWSLAMREGYVDDVLHGAEDRDWLVEKCREILDGGDTRTESVQPMQVGPAPGHERAWALSQLVVGRARTDSDVVAFRANYLDHELVRWTDIERWIKTRAELDGARTPDLTVTLPGGTVLERGRDRLLRVTPPIAEIRTGYRLSTRTIDYALPGDPSVRSLAVTAGGVLDRLRTLANSLAGSFCWQPAQATVFVLADVVPFIATVRVTMPAIKVRDNVEIGWGYRITLDVDPAASRQEVLVAFEQARSERRQVPRRALSIKHLRLAAFTGAEHADKPWAERHRLWNKHFPEWAYAAPSNFRRDAALAQRHILYPLRSASSESAWHPALLV